MNTMCLIACGLLFVPAMASAADLALTGTGTANWDRTEAIWQNEAGTLQKFADGDNVLIGGTTFTGGKVQLNAWLNPGDVVFSNEQEIVLTKSSAESTAFGSNTKSLSKWGTGVLRLYPMWNYNLCPWHVYQGTLSFPSAWIDKCCIVGDTRNGLSPMIYVHDGAVLEDPSNQGLGRTGETAEAEDNCASVTVYTNGVFRPGWNYGGYTYAYPKTIVKDLIFDGGTFDFSRRGSWNWGLLKVTRKLAFKGKVPYTGIKFSQMDSKISFAASRQTEIEVADISGDASVDVSFADSKIGRETEGGIVGFKKTGPGTLAFEKKIYNSQKESALGWIGLNGPVSVTEGTLRFEAGDNAFTGRVDVTGGTLRLGNNLSAYAVPSDPTCSYVGSLVQDREIVASGSGTITFINRYMFDKLVTTGNEPTNKIRFVARDGGALHLGVAGMTTKAHVTFPNLYLDGGSLVFNGDGDWPNGVISVVGTFGFSGTKAYTITPNTAVSSRNSQVLCLNANSKTCFDVADITGDAAADVTFTLPMGISGCMCAEAEKTAADGTVTKNRSHSNGYDANISVGFRKTGPGTLRLAFECSGLGAAGMLPPNGVFSVEEGALEVDSDIYHAPASNQKDYHFGVAVGPGAYLQQPSPANPATALKYRVMRTLTVAENGGFRVFAERTNARYTVNGTLSLPAAGRIDLVVPEGLDARVVKVPLLSVGGNCTVTGGTDFEDWTFTVNGEAAPGKVYSVRREGDLFYVAGNFGTTVLFR